MLFSRFLQVHNDIVSLNLYVDIFKQKEITKVIHNNHFHYFNELLLTVMKALIIVLYMYSAKYSTINSF